MSWDWTRIDWRAGWVPTPLAMHARKPVFKINSSHFFLVTEHWQVFWCFVSQPVCVWVCVCVCVCVQISDLLAELADERSTSESASQLLETETSERLRLEKDMKDLQAHTHTHTHCNIWNKIQRQWDIFWLVYERVDFRPSLAAWRNN